MNRRNFLASVVALPAGIVAAAKAVARPPELDLNEIFAQLYALRRNRAAAQPIIWIQTTRTTHCASMDYLDTLDVVMGVPEPDRRANYIARRKERSRRNLAELKAQRPLPIS